jgi:hypothetical protein
MIKERERQTRLVTFNPECDFAQIDSKRVLVHRIDAAPDHIADGMAMIGRVRLSLS